MHNIYISANRENVGNSQNYQGTAHCTTKSSHKFAAAWPSDSGLLSQFEPERDKILAKSYQMVCNQHPLHDSLVCLWYILMHEMCGLGVQKKL